MCQHSHVLWPFFFLGRSIFEGDQLQTHQTFTEEWEFAPVQEKKKSLSLQQLATFFPLSHNDEVGHHWVAITEI